MRRLSKTDFNTCSRISGRDTDGSGAPNGEGRDDHHPRPYQSRVPGDERGPEAPRHPAPADDRRSPPRLLAVTDVAQLLQVSSKTVRRWIERRELRTHRLGRQLRVAEEDLAAFLGQHRK